VDRVSNMGSLRKGTNQREKKREAYAPTPRTNILRRKKKWEMNKDRREKGEGGPKK